MFEFLDVDLKRYMEYGNSTGAPLTLDICKVSAPVASFGPTAISVEMARVRRAAAEADVFLRCASVK